ncbi:MAG: glycosyltransferase [Bacteroidales bacterium]|nr:glycosyltransferase [Bacteroidales bacterium]
MKNPLISVIVPIYNVELYLRECVNSIINQTYSNIEIILVNDGSTDSCLDICKELEILDQRIILLDKPNGGLSDARNFALDCIKGDYITFVDSDDYIRENYIETLYNLIVKYNCLISSVGKIEFIDTPVNSENKDVSVKVLSKREAIKNILQERDLTTSAWGKLYKSNLFTNVRFPKGQLYEDLSTIYKIFDQVEQMAFYNIPLYCYRKNPNSIMNSRFRVQNMDFVNAHNDIIKYVEGNFPELLLDAKNRKTRYACSFLIRSFCQGFNDPKIIAELRQIIKENIYNFLISNYSLKKKLFAIAECFMPKFTKEIIKLLLYK